MHSGYRAIAANVDIADTASVQSMVKYAVKGFVELIVALIVPG
jgi:hypothetical protein